MGKYNNSAGHNPDGKIGSGAIGLIKESTEARKVVEEMCKLLRENGHTANDLTVNNGTSATDVLNKLIEKHNGISADMNISVHFNSGANDKNGNGKTTGVEVLVYNLSADNTVAKRVCDSIAKSTGLTNRGLKERPNLAFLRGTKGKAMLIECCFVDDADDVKLYNYKTMAKAIVEGILNKSISDGGTSTMKKYCVLYSNAVDKTIAEVMSWKLNDFIVQDVADFKSYSAENLYVIGGRTEEALKAKKLPDKYTAFNGVDRYDTLNQVLTFQPK